MKKDLKLLLLEDDPADAELIQILLRRAGIRFGAVVASNEEEFLTALAQNGYDAVLADNALPQYSSMEALKLLRITNPDIAFILVTGTVSEEFAVNIIQQGADDYILKTNLTRLPSAISNAIEKKRNMVEKENAVKETMKEKELSVSIINSLPGIFFLCNSQGKFLRWNKNFEQVAGYSSAEMALMTPEYFFSGTDKDHFRHYIDNCLERGSGQTEVTFVTREHFHLPYFFTGMAINYENQECLICVGLDISARKESEKKLIQLNEELHDVSSHLETIRENEQKRIAREVHDQLGQQLTGLKMDISWLKDKMEKISPPEVITEKLENMSQLVDEAVNTVRKVASDLRPPVLDDFGIVDALHWQSKEFTKRSGITVKFNSNLENSKIDQSVSIGLFRIYQEALINVARHAEAKNIHTSFELTQQKLLLIVSDDGKGFDVKQGKKSLGLLGMKERAYMINGTVQIESMSGKGTKVIVSVLINEVDKSGNEQTLQF
jgi:PAS domain S-box-containing protein